MLVGLVRGQCRVYFFEVVVVFIMTPDEIQRACGHSLQARLLERAEGSGISGDEHDLRTGDDDLDLADIYEMRSDQMSFADPPGPFVL